MDRSFLSRPEVITASRAFVCIRLTSYEDDSEAKFCQSLFTGRSGEVENTTFALFAPDGKTTLSRVGRGTRGIFADAKQMAETMNTIAARYPAREIAGKPALPTTLDIRLGVNVAASDGQLLVVVLARDPKTRADLEGRVSAAAWSDEFIGRCTYAVASSAKELKSIEGVRDEEGVLIVSPDTFGQKGKVVCQIAELSKGGFEEALRKALASHKADIKDSRTHRAGGVEAGMFWEPKLPVTDPQEAAARARTKERIGKKKD